MGTCSSSRSFAHPISRDGSATPHEQRDPQSPICRPALPRRADGSRRGAVPYDRIVPAPTTVPARDEPTFRANPTATHRPPPPPPPPQNVKASPPYPGSPAKLIECP